MSNYKYYVLLVYIIADLNLVTYPHHGDYLQNTVFDNRTKN